MSREQYIAIINNFLSIINLLNSNVCIKYSYLTDQDCFNVSNLILFPWLHHASWKNCRASRPRTEKGALLKLSEQLYEILPHVNSSADSNALFFYRLLLCLWCKIQHVSEQNRRKTEKTQPQFGTNVKIKKLKIHDSKSIWTVQY